MESIPEEGAVKIVEITTKDLKYYINLIEKAVTGSERCFNLENSVGKMVSNNIECYRKVAYEREINSCNKCHGLILRNFYRLPDL